MDLPQFIVAQQLGRTISFFELHGSFGRFGELHYFLLRHAGFEAAAAASLIHSSGSHYNQVVGFD
jgi:hypothetical protein